MKPRDASVAVCLRRMIVVEKIDMMIMIGRRVEQFS
jgi:hypothetical protein